MKIEALVQLHTGDAIRGIVSRRAPWFRHLKVQNATAVEGRTGRSAPADGIIWVPKRNVQFIQELHRVVPFRTHALPERAAAEDREAPKEEPPQEVPVTANFQAT